jgi:pimeloyl-ACP methyl ester carboxylesterase
MSKGRVLGWIAVGLLAVGAPISLLYGRDIGAARRRLSGSSQLVETSSGVIEYAIAGAGKPLLSIHGTGGGFDQGLIQARMFGIDLARYKVIAPSRFGYLRTPMPDGPSTPADEARAHAELLDALGIQERVTVMGVSAGALSALQFALLYPDRVDKLILMVPATWALNEGGQSDVQKIGGNKFIVERVLRSDFLYWSFQKLARGQMLSFVGVPPAQQQRLSVEDRRNIAEVIDGMLPVSQRYAGIMKDDRNQQALQPYPVAQIEAGTLIVDAADVETYRGSVRLAQAIPNSAFVSFDSGGHLLIGHGAAVRAAIGNFLESNPSRRDRLPRHGDV